jgi:tetratricopeptide (TPR) repeat protein
VKIRQIVRKALVASLALGCAGCSTTGTKNWFPAWPGASSTASVAPTKPGGGLGTPATQPTGLAAAWQQTTKSLTSAITPASAQEPDPVSLDNSPQKVGSEVYLSAARIHEQRGDLPGAIAQYQKSIASNPRDVTAHIGLARIYDRQGEYARAVEQYQKAIQIDPKRALPRNDLGLCYARHGELEKSIAELQQAVKLQPESKLYRNNLATVLVEANREQEALQQLLAAHPPAAAHYNLGALLSRCGKSALAAKHLQQALAVDPGLTAAQQLLAQIEQPSSASDAVAAEPSAPPARSAWNEQSQIVSASGGAYPTGNAETAPIVESKSATGVQPTTVTPYSPGSVYHIGDEELSPVFMGQNQSRRQPSSELDERQTIPAVTSFLGKPSWRKYLPKEDELRESIAPQTLELNDDIVRATPVFAADGKTTASEAKGELRPVSAELEIEAP